MQEFYYLVKITHDIPPEIFISYIEQKVVCSKIYDKNENIFPSGRGLPIVSSKWFLEEFHVPHCIHGDDHSNDFFLAIFNPPIIRNVNEGVEHQNTIFLYSII